MCSVISWTVCKSLALALDTQPSLHFITDVLQATCSYLKPNQLCQSS